MRQTINNARKNKCTKARSLKTKRLCTEFHYDKTEKSSEQANYIMNLPRPSSSGKLGAWTREGQQKVDDITSTHVWYYCIMNSAVKIVTIQRTIMSIR